MGNGSDSPLGDISSPGLDIDVRNPRVNEIDVVLSGELDLYTSPRLEDELEGLESSKTTVVLDLADVSFLDSTGLRALWQIRQQVAAAGGTMLLRSPSASVMRVLATTKLDKVFEFVSPDL
jgi:anti-sigma B factor antagonist